MLVGLRAALDLLAACGCRRAWLDGSFVTDVEIVAGQAPRDFDLCWDMDEVDLARLERVSPALRPFHRDQAEQQRQFGGDCFPVTEPLGPGSPGLLTFFQRDRDKRAKGIILLALRGAEEGADDRE